MADKRLRAFSPPAIDPRTGLRSSTIETVEPYNESGVVHQIVDPASVGQRTPTTGSSLEPPPSSAIAVVRLPPDVSKKHTVPSDVRTRTQIVESRLLEGEQPSEFFPDPQRSYYDYPDLAIEVSLSGNYIDTFRPLADALIGPMNIGLQQPREFSTIVAFWAPGGELGLPFHDITQTRLEMMKRFTLIRGDASAIAVWLSTKALDRKLQMLFAEERKKPSGDVLRLDAARLEMPSATELDGRAIILTVVTGRAKTDLAFPIPKVFETDFTLTAEDTLVDEPNPAPVPQSAGRHLVCKSRVFWKGDFFDVAGVIIGAFVPGTSLEAGLGVAGTAASGREVNQKEFPGGGVGRRIFEALPKEYWPGPAAPNPDRFLGLTTSIPGSKRLPTTAESAVSIPPPLDPSVKYSPAIAPREPPPPYIGGDKWVLPWEQVISIGKAGLILRTLVHILPLADRKPELSIGGPTSSIAFPVLPGETLRVLPAREVFRAITKDVSPWAIMRWNGDPAQDIHIVDPDSWETEIEFLVPTLTGSGQGVFRSITLEVRDGPFQLRAEARIWVYVPHKINPPLP